jgi:glutaminase
MEPTRRFYPALARVPSELFGVCVVATSGQVYGAGEVDYEFSIMSGSKPCLFALVCETIGPEEARARLGSNATGPLFNSLAAIEQGSGRTNPMVNARAIATTSLAPGGGITVASGLFGVLAGLVILTGFPITGCGCSACCWVSTFCLMASDG